MVNLHDEQIALIIEHLEIDFDIFYTQKSDGNTHFFDIKWVINDLKKQNNFSAILKAAFCPLSSPSKQIIGFEKNFHIRPVSYTHLTLPTSDLV